MCLRCISCPYFPITNSGLKMLGVDWSYAWSGTIDLNYIMDMNSLY